MPRDYAPNKRNKRKQVAKKPKRSWLRVIFTLLITAGLIAAFIYIAQQPVDKAAKATASKNNTPPPKPKPKLIAPVQDTAPAESVPKAETNRDFAFYDMLPESEIIAPEVAAYKSDPKDPNKTISQRLQTGSFRNEQDAQKQRAQLILIGMDNITIEKTNSAEYGVWYRVRIGPFQNRSQLNKAIDVLVDNGFGQPLKIN